MKHCRKCGNKIPSWIKINGVLHNLGNRVHCLDCVPFKKKSKLTYEARNEARQNRQKIVSKENKRICEVCNREYVYHRRKGHTLKRCNSCMTNYRRFKLRKRIYDYKGSKCEICGYDRYTEALTFHHRDPDKKEFNISGSHSRSWESIKHELDKCNLLCLNCHAEIHAGHIAKLGIASGLYESNPTLRFRGNPTVRGSKVAGVCEGPTTSVPVTSLFISLPFDLPSG